MQWCFPCLRQQAGRRDSASPPSANSGEISGKLNSISSVMDIRRRTKDLKIVAVLRSWRLVRMGQFRVAADRRTTAGIAAAGLQTLGDLCGLGNTSSSMSSPSRCSSHTEPPLRSCLNGQTMTMKRSMSSVSPGQAKTTLRELRWRSIQKEDLGETLSGLPRPTVARRTKPSMPSRSSKKLSKAYRWTVAAL